MSHQVFISYARSASAAHAQALAGALGDLAFLDTGAIADGEPFPQRLLDELLDASLVVIFAAGAYAESLYCRLELRLALAGGDGSHLVLALGDGYDSVLHGLPTAVTAKNWPRAEETQRLAALVHARLQDNPPAIRNSQRDRMLRTSAN